MSPEVVDDLNRVPVKVVNGSPILIRDVAHVRDGAPPQLNIVRSDGRHSVLVTILKNGNASTLSVVDAVKSFLPTIRAAAPKDMKITPLFDQSVFVSGAISDVVREGVIAAGADGRHDPAVPRLVALDPHRAGVDPARHPDLADGALLPRRDHQHHDAGRPRARGRHPGRRRHRGDREYLPAHGGGAQLQGFGRRGRRRHRQAGPDLDAVDLLGLRVGVLPHRHAPLPVRAPGHGGRLRHAGLLSPVADAGADPHRRPRAPRIRPAPRRARGRGLAPPRASSPGSTPASRRASPASIAAISGCCAAPSTTSSRPSRSWAACCSWAAGCSSSSGGTISRRSTPAP